MLLGSAIGGLVVKKLKLTKKGMAKMVVILKPFTLLILPLFLFLGCNNREIAGITANYPSSNTWVFVLCRSFPFKGVLGLPWSQTSKLKSLFPRKFVQIYNAQGITETKMI